MTEEQVHALKAGDKVFTPKWGVVVIDEVMRSPDGRGAVMVATAVVPEDPKLPVVGMMLYTVMDGEDVINTNALALEFVH